MNRRSIYSEYITLRSEYETKLQEILEPLIISWILTVKDPGLYIQDKQHHRKYLPFYNEELKCHYIIQDPAGNGRVRYSRDWGLINTIRGNNYLLPFGNQILDLNLEYYLKYCEFFSTKLFKCPDLEERKLVIDEVLSDFGYNKSKSRAIFSDVDAIRYYTSLPDPDFKASWRDKKDPMRHIKNIVPRYTIIDSKNDLKDSWSNFGRNSLRIDFNNFFPLCSPNHVVIVRS